MSCFESGYHPIPARVWPRTESAITYENILSDSDNKTVISPLTGKNIPYGLLANHIQMIHKGNVLQYKNNSGLSKAQQYSLKVRGKWTNSGKTWASQGAHGSNPNTRNLQQVGGHDVTVATKPPGSCPLSEAPFVIQNGGHLVSGTSVDPCTGTVTTNKSRGDCFLTSASNVPGQVKVLCWNPRIKTWFPRNERNMNNSGNKWPTNHKFVANR